VKAELSVFLIKYYTLDCIWDSGRITSCILNISTRRKCNPPPSCVLPAWLLQTTWKTQTGKSCHYRTRTIRKIHCMLL